MKIEINSLTHIFKNGKPHRPVLEDISLEINSGQFTAIIGPSGCGKSTLLRLAGDLIQPSHGSLRIDGCTPTQARKAGEIAWMAQSPALLPWLTAQQNVSLARKFVRAGRHPRISAAQALERVGLDDVESAYPFTLSGGMQQRLALARLLALDAGVWLMDEPFAALDEITREKLTTELLSLWQPLQPTVLWVTHNYYEALRLADRVVVMTPSPGRIAADVNISLPRPRREDHPGFQQYLASLRDIMAQANRSQVEH